MLSLFTIYIHDAVALFKASIVRFVCKTLNIEMFVIKAYGRVLLTDTLLEYYCRTGLVCDAEDMMQKLTSKIKKSDVSIDIGANTGITTLWLAQHSNKVYAFEPEPSNQRQFQLNIELNSASNIELVPTAISNFIGTAKFNVLEGYGHHSLGNVHTSKRIKVINVKVDTLDNYCSKNKITEIDVLKVDVEGCELEVFKGAKKLLQQRKINLIIFEVSNILLKQLHKNKLEIFEYLTENGYKVFNLSNKPVKREDFQNIIQDDLYAIPI